MEHGQELFSLPIPFAKLKAAAKPCVTVTRSLITLHTQIYMMSQHMCIPLEVGTSIFEENKLAELEYVPDVCQTLSGKKISQFYVFFNQGNVKSSNRF